MTKCYNSRCPFMPVDSVCPCTLLCGRYASEPTRITYSTSSVPIEAEYTEVDDG